MRVHRVHAIAVLATSILLVGCQRRDRPSPAPPQAEGRVTGQAFDTRTRGLGGLSRITIALHRPTVEYSRAHIWIDSLTVFVGPARDSVDWSLPQLRDAHLRVWFRGQPSTPNAGEVWGKAATVAIDSITRMAVR
jgi:hypothetical protein